MPSPCSCVSRISLAAVVTVLVAFLASGCRWDEAARTAPVDTAYIAPPVQKRQVSFTVSFARYSPREADIINEAWAAAIAPAEAQNDLWRDNGLRVAAASGAAADEVAAKLAAASTLKVSNQQVVLPSRPSFDLYIGGRLAGGGLVYRTARTRAYRDVSNLQLKLQVLVSGRGKEARTWITPFFTEVSDSGEAAVTMLDGLEVVFPYEQKQIILVAAVEDPPEMRLSTVMAEGSGDRQTELLVILEPSLTW